MSSAQTRQLQWQKILDMTRRMRQLSEKENWAAVLEVQGERQSLIETFFASPVNESEAEQLADGIRAIMQSDQQLMQQGAEQYKQLGQSLLNMSTSRKAINAYDRCR